MLVVVSLDKDWDLFILVGIKASPSLLLLNPEPPQLEDAVPGLPTERDADESLHLVLKLVVIPYVTIDVVQQGVVLIDLSPQLL